VVEPPADLKHALAAGYSPDDVRCRMSCKASARASPAYVELSADVRAVFHPARDVAEDLPDSRERTVSGP
jgi:hypothetical protein